MLVLKTKIAPFSTALKMAVVICATDTVLVWTIPNVSVKVDTVVLVVQKLNVSRIRAMPEVNAT